MTDPLAKEIAKVLDASLHQIPNEARVALAERRAKALRRPKVLAWTSGALAASFLVAAMAWQYSVAQAPNIDEPDTELSALNMLEAEPQMLEDMDLLMALGDADSDS